MLTLSLLRHAKSKWDPHQSLSDFDRGLNERGRRAAPLMGGYMAEQGLVPDLILCSSARRACETLELVLSQLPDEPKVKHRKDLYLASPGTLLSRIRNVSAKYKWVMVVGHNPGMHALALGLCSSGDATARRDLASKFPTAALAVFSFDIDDWARIEQADGHLERFVVPRALE